eukprot:3031655-Rhodomonas_salina.1
MVRACARSPPNLCQPPLSNAPTPHSRTPTLARIRRLCVRRLFEQEPTDSRRRACLREQHVDVARRLDHPRPAAVEAACAPFGAQEMHDAEPPRAGEHSAVLCCDLVRDFSRRSGDAVHGVRDLRWERAEQDRVSGKHQSGRACVREREISTAARADKTLPTEHTLTRTRSLAEPRFPVLHTLHRCHPNKTIPAAYLTFSVLAQP